MSSRFSQDLEMKEQMPPLEHGTRGKICDAGIDLEHPSPDIEKYQRAVPDALEAVFDAKVRHHMN